MVLLVPLFLGLKKNLKILIIHYFQIWLICFLSVSVETYLSPVETHCMNIEYYIPDVDNLTRDFSEDAMTRLRK